MYTVIVVIAIIVSILLIVVVLIQNSKGGGLAANFAAGNQIFGVRQTADQLEKATWTLAIALALLCLLGTMFPPTRVKVGESAVQKGIENVQTPVTTQPNFPATTPAQTSTQAQPAATTTEQPAATVTEPATTTEQPATSE